MRKKLEILEKVKQSKCGKSPEKIKEKYETLNKIGKNWINSEKIRKIQKMLDKFGKYFSERLETNVKNLRKLREIGIFYVSYPG